MNLKQTVLRLGLAAALLGGLGACTVVPAYPSAGYYRAPPPAYVEPYPVYSYPGASIYYESGHRHYGGRGGRHYRDDRYHDHWRR
jgi:hypothetical protein